MTESVKQMNSKNHAPGYGVVACIFEPENATFDNRNDSPRRKESANAKHDEPAKTQESTSEHSHRYVNSWQTVSVGRLTERPK